jgi:hypothetical protein
MGACVKIEEAISSNDWWVEIPQKICILNLREKLFIQIVQKLQMGLGQSDRPKWVI